MKSFEFLREADDTDRYETYTIQRGDTLGKLATRFDTTVKGLMWLNPQIDNPDLIITGNTLRVPKTGGGEPVQPSPKPVPSPKPKPKPAANTSGVSDGERAWLNMIAGPESGGDYDIINHVARDALKDKTMKKTPNPPGHHPFEGQKGYTAAGRYQMIWTTWKTAAQLAGVDPYDFSPENQDRAALALGKDLYQRKHNRDLVADLQDPKFRDQAIQDSTGPWSKKAGGAGGFNADKYAVALNDLGVQVADPKAKK